MNLCVFCAASNELAPVYQEAAMELGAEMGKRGHRLVYGGGHVGLMGILARAVHQQGGLVTGVIPEALYVREVAYTDADELIVTTDMRTRKAKMDELADVFIALPGGYGTLEELVEVITAKSIGLHNKPIFILNTNHFYQPLQRLFEHFETEGFASPQTSQLYHIVPSVSAVLNMI